MEENTREIEKFYRENGVKTYFEVNKGNHFQNAVERTASGIAWILKR